MKSLITYGQGKSFMSLSSLLRSFPTDKEGNLKISSGGNGATIPCAVLHALEQVEKLVILEMAKTLNS